VDVFLRLFRRAQAESCAEYLRHVVAVSHGYQHTVSNTHVIRIVMGSVATLLFFLIRKGTEYVVYPVED